MLKRGSISRADSRSLSFRERRKLRLATSSKEEVAESKKPSVAAPIPQTRDISSIPLSVSRQYDLSDAEAKAVRSNIYHMNKTDPHRRRWRTIREGRILFVWRIR